MRLGWPEILLILAIVLIFFGVGKLPQVGESIGKAMRSFKKAQEGVDEEEEKQATVKSSDTKKTASKKA
jgi:sec-independent protein translocase protein TatA